MSVTSDIICTNKVNPTQAIDMLYQRAIYGKLYHDDRDLLLEILDSEIVRLLQVGKLQPVQVTMWSSPILDKMSLHIQQQGKQLKLSPEVDLKSLIPSLDAQETIYYECLKNVALFGLTLPLDPQVVAERIESYQVESQRYQQESKLFELELQERTRQQHDYSRKLKAWRQQLRHAADRWAKTHHKQVSYSHHGLVKQEWLQTAYEQGFQFNIPAPIQPLQNCPMTHSKPKQAPTPPVLSLKIDLKRYSLGQSVEVDDALAWATSLVLSPKKAINSCMTPPSIWGRLDDALLQREFQRVKQKVLILFKQILSKKLTDGKQILRSTPSISRGL